MKHITVSEAAERCRVHPATIRRWVKEGILKYDRTIGGHTRFLAKDLDDLMTRRAAIPPQVCQEPTRTELTIEQQAVIMRIAKLEDTIAQLVANERPGDVVQSAKAKLMWSKRRLDRIETLLKDEQPKEEGDK